MGPSDSMMFEIFIIKPLNVVLIILREWNRYVKITIIKHDLFKSLFYSNDILSITVFTFILVTDFIPKKKVLILDRCVILLNTRNLTFTHKSLCLTTPVIDPFPLYTILTINENYHIYIKFTPHVFTFEYFTVSF